MVLTEQQKNCKWCHPGSNIKSRYGLDPWDQGTLRLNEVADDRVEDDEDYTPHCCFDPKNAFLSAEGEGDALFLNIQYCPFCGRKLGGSIDE